jgi:chromosome segregation ATPase
MSRDMTLTGPIQTELDNVIRANTAAMNEEQLRTHIQDVNTGLIALSQLPATSRLHKLLSAQQSAKDVEARISASQRELALTQQKLKEMEEKTPECDHRELEEKIRDLERQLGARAPEQAELERDLEDAQAQLEVMREIAEEYREQVTQIHKLMEGRIGGGGNHEDKEEQGSKIARFSGEDRKDLRGWKVQLALKIAGKPRTFDTKQK